MELEEKAGLKLNASVNLSYSEIAELPNKNIF
ncbi:hypothetical protein CpipJ_CPIJ017604 [Culex quinquefasciatus]|uniref:Uncharacterized protein n=1 Tax=Culex quinquefasciatus TaxID=7176 RepID=B0XDK8_CULQU|nr:hypothetical protein CpipJ_CPIJ017604 [Culex quinquefasciatus]|eukprot:XP_001867730.1 hypothetical protein CpipJ_CPIJ017604 [Culex quinquefasciatus]